MPILTCPFTGCEERVDNEDKELAIALFNAHTLTHTVSTGRNQGGGPSKSEKLTRPKISQGMLTESWNSFLSLWKLYKNGVGLTEAECSLQLIYCCDEELMGQLLRADQEMVSKSEADQLELIR